MDLTGLARIRKRDSRSISAENPDGAVGNGGKAASNLGPGRKGKAYLDLAPETETVIADIHGQGVISHIWITVQDSTEYGEFVLRDLVLRMYWDDSPVPSVEVPLGDFFCCGFSTKCVINSLPIAVAPYGGFNSFFPMPFRKRARITVENPQKVRIHCFFYTINYSLVDELDDDTGYFHAQWRRTRYSRPGEDHVILDGVEGSGQYVGTYFAWTALERYWWGEGEVKMYIDDDEEYPTICGTGVEDYVGGAWGFYEKDAYGKTSRVESTYSMPFMGYPFHSTVSGSAELFGHDAVPMHGLYRWHIMDPVYFDKSIRVTVQQIGHDGNHLYERADDVATVAYWYQRNINQRVPALPSREGRRPR